MAAQPNRTGAKRQRRRRARRILADVQLAALTIGAIAEAIRAIASAIGR
jgi:hypothetical protein